MNSLNLIIGVVLCVLAAAVARDDRYSNLPTPDMANIAKLEHYVNKTELSPYTKYIVENGLTRIKRQAPRANRGGTMGDNTHWCCKEDPVSNKEYHTRSVKELVPVTKTRRTSGKCGFGGWKRCTRDATYTSMEVRYKTVIDTREVPAPEWINGCPDRKIVCCRGFVLNKFVNNCMTNAEVDELLGILTKHRDALSLLEQFGAGR